MAWAGDFLTWPLSVPCSPVHRAHWPCLITPVHFGPPLYKLQVEAIRLALELSSRLPNLVELLQAGGGGGSGAGDDACAALRRGYGQALKDSLLGAGAGAAGGAPRVVDNLEEGGGWWGRQQSVVHLWGCVRF